MRCEWIRTRRLEKVVVAEDKKERGGDVENLTSSTFIYISQQMILGMTSRGAYWRWLRPEACRWQLCCLKLG